MKNQPPEEIKEYLESIRCFYCGTKENISISFKMCEKCIKTGADVKNWNEDDSDNYVDYF